ncbi:MAG: DUF2795 domain-containing protein [Tomitella sp.]|nr:DUF2795 domain-containing protein [Tomitella sp.]
MTTRDDMRADKALQGMEFPADKAAVLDYARTRYEDAKTMQALEALPDRTYGSKDDLVDAVPQEPEGKDVPGGVDR